MFADIYVFHAIAAQRALAHMMVKQICAVCVVNSSQSFSQSESVSQSVGGLATKVGMFAVSGL
jgi:hypothetical protein